MDKKKEEKIQKAVKELSKQPANKRCADCTEKLPQYVNLTFNTFICTGKPHIECAGTQRLVLYADEAPMDCLGGAWGATACSGIHREFSHRVKSISLSTFTIEEYQALKGGGNEAASRQVHAGRGVGSLEMSHGLMWYAQNLSRPLGPSRLSGARGGQRAEGPGVHPLQVHRQEMVRSRSSVDVCEALCD
jgi:hypothetical protein